MGTLRAAQLRRVSYWALAGCMFVFTAARAQDYVPGEVIVKLKSQAGSAPSFAFLGKAKSQKDLTLRQSFGKLNVHHFALRKGQRVEDAVAELRADPEVEYAEPNYILRKSTTGELLRTFSASEIQQAQAANPLVTTGGADIGLSEFYQSKSVGAASSGAAKPVIAVIDTGVDVSHPVFSGTNAIWTNPGEVPSNGIDDDGNGYVDDVHGWNFITNSGVMYDDDNHGTHVAGIILSVDQDIFAMNLQDSRIAIMPVKFLDGAGVGSTANAIRAIYYAVQNGATVLNNSWGGPSYSSALHEAIIYAYSHGVSFVAAAGNGDSYGRGYNTDVSPMYPASYTVPNVISVAAIQDNLNLASFSNFGSHSVHLGSPGVWVYSTISGGFFGAMSGTSMATPYVAGVAIQMKVEAPTMLSYQLKSIILDESTLTSPLQGKVVTNGRLSVNNSIQAAKFATIDGSQPIYQSSFTQNRELASTLSGGGCGMVGKLADRARDRFGGPGGGAAPSTWYVLLVIALVSMPFFVVAWLRQRSPQQRRRYERFRINSQVTVMAGDRELVGSISTISLGGVQLNTAELLEKGGVVKMQISSPDGREQIDVEGHVVWSEARKAYGVAFDHAPQTVLSRIQNWTRALPKSG